jgi:[ribosomal protein S18]-alanine N-acetyltransferase
MTFRIRQHRQEDLEDIFQIETLSFPEKIQFSQETLTSLLATHRHSFVAESAGSVAGFAITETRGSTGYILTLNVHPKFRRQGVGMQLLKRTEASIFHRAKCTRIYLHVGMENAAAIQLYYSAGYVKKGVCKRFYADGANAFEMFKLLGPSSTNNSLSS